MVGEHDLKCASL